MRKLMMAFVLVFAVFFGAEAQNRSIEFEQTKVWKKILKIAIKEKKLIFVDCYTSWCGPCKMLSSQVFTQDAVADFFNANFVNAKYDMEKDADGVILKDKFEVKAFPTLVFVDPVTGEAVHRMVGAGKAEWLIAGGKQAMDPQGNLSGMMKRYAAGERSAEFLQAYLPALASAYMKEEVGKVAAEYLNTLSVDRLATKENWDLIKQYVQDPLSAPLKAVMANRDKFYAVAGKEVVDYKLEGAIYGAVMMLSNWKLGMGTAFDEQRNAELTGYLLHIDSQMAPIGLANLYTAAYVRKGDYRGLLDKMREVMSYNMLRGGLEKHYFQTNIEAFQSCTDKALVEEAIRWIDERCVNTEDYFAKADLMNSKARLQRAIGDTLGADKSKMEEEKYAKEGQERSGGRIQRAMRMN